MAVRFPFSPDVLDSIPEEIQELYRGLEIDVLTKICEQLKLTGKANEVTLQDIRALRSHGISVGEIKKAVSNTSGLALEKVEKIFDEVVAQNNRFYNQLIDLSGVTKPETLVDEEDVWAIYEQTKGQFRNLTQSYAFMVRDGRGWARLNPAQSYQWALDRAIIKVQSGAYSYNQAITEAVRHLADSGIKVAEYDKNGKPYYSQIDVAARRAIMTGVNQLNQKYREQSMDYLETDLVEVTAHLGARNILGAGDPPWVAHTYFQGKVFHWSKNSAFDRTRFSKYPDFLDSTGYGDVQGLGGANCRHSFWPFLEGFMEPTYKEEELENMKPENRPRIEYGGKQYDEYQATQVQRRIEAEVRKLKRREAAYRAAGAEKQAEETLTRIRKLNDGYRAFSKAAGLRTQFERMRVVYD